jgi:aromatic ring-cleaving dioxygenase
MSYHHLTCTFKNLEHFDLLFKAAIAWIQFDHGGIACLIKSLTGNQHTVYSGKYIKITA